MNAGMWLLAGLIAGSALGFVVAAMHCAALRAQLEEDYDREMETENKQLRALLSEWAEEAQEGDFP